MVKKNISKETAEVKPISEGQKKIAKERSMRMDSTNDGKIKLPKEDLIPERMPSVALDNDSRSIMIDESHSRNAGGEQDMAAALADLNLEQNAV